MVARKTSALPTRIWSFAARPPTENAGAVETVVTRARDYYAALVAIERERYRDYQETRAFYAPELREAEIMAFGVEDLFTRKSALAAASSLKREFEATLGPARAEFSRRKKKRGEGLAPIQRAKTNAAVLTEMLLEPEWPESWKELEQVTAAALDRSKAARASCGLTQGCYVMVEQAVAAAIDASLPGPPNERRDPKSIPVRIGVQFTSSPTVAGLIRGHSLVAISFIGSEWATVRIRIGDSVYAEFPVRFHHLPPPDAIVKWAWVRRREALPWETEHRYELQLTLEHESFRELPWRRGNGVVRLTSCLEHLPNGGMRVARWAGHDGRSGEVIVPVGLMRRLAHPDTLIRHADARRDRAYRVLRLWLWRTGNRVTMRTPWKHGDWRLEPIKAIARAYAESVLGAGHERGDPRRELWEAWKTERKSRHLDLYADLREASLWLRARGLSSPEQAMAWWLEIWTRKDTHLRRVATDTRRHAENSREELYREQAIWLTRRYGTLETDSEKITQHDASAATMRELAREYFGLPRSPGKRERVGEKRKSTEPDGPARNAENIMDSQSDKAQPGAVDDGAAA